MENIDHSEFHERLLRPLLLIDGAYTIAADEPELVIRALEQEALEHDISTKTVVIHAYTSEDEISFDEDILLVAVHEECPMLEKLRQMLAEGDFESMIIVGKKDHLAAFGELDFVVGDDEDDEPEASKIDINAMVGTGSIGQLMAVASLLSEVSTRLDNLADRSMEPEIAQELREIVKLLSGDQ